MFKKSDKKAMIATLAASGLGLIASIVLSYEALILAANKDAVLSCDINAVVSCAAVANHWSATLLARDLMMQSYGQVKDRWAATLSAQLARGEWAEIPAPAPALPAPGKVSLSREDAARMLAELEASGVTKSPRATHFDHKTWARKIMARLAKGDKSLQAMQITNAKTALGII